MKTILLIEDDPYGLLRYEGKISDNVKKIIGNLQTTNEMEIDQTVNEWVFNGNNEKPFYKLLGLATRSVPEAIPNALGNIAGYFFFENKPIQSLQKFFLPIY